ncbi:MAG: epoxyqueuosine reductase QueH [Ruminococcus flavefaciens]|nr:epoxyqueuosine reductase QueH [Ruminococcus flavefaciens]
MQKVNYGKILDDKIKELQKSGVKPSLLLHACCAPCSSHTMDFLEKYFSITLYFCNPNISPESEFIYRLDELKRLVSEMNLDIEIIEEKYNPEVFYQLAKGLEKLPERSERCQKCIAHRLKMTGEKARQLGFDYFTTTLTISPHKDCTFINECGAEISAECGVEYLFSDFKKHDGYKHSIELSKKYSLYRQNYCGCIYSKINSEKR